MVQRFGADATAETSLRVALEEAARQSSPGTTRRRREAQAERVGAGTGPCRRGRGTRSISTWEPECRPQRDRLDYRPRQGGGPGSDLGRRRHDDGCSGDFARKYGQAVAHTDERPIADPDQPGQEQVARPASADATRSGLHELHIRAVSRVDSSLGVIHGTIPVFDTATEPLLPPGCEWRSRESQPRQEEAELERLHQEPEGSRRPPNRRHISEGLDG